MSSVKSEPLNAERALKVLGWGYALDRLDHFEEHFQRWVREHGVKTLDEFKATLQRHPDYIRELVEQVVIKESYFFRHPEDFELLEQSVMPALLARKQQLNVLSIGCAAGEEPYSLAMLFAAKGWLQQTNIYAVDVSLTAIQQAQQGVYSDWAMREPCALSVYGRFFKTVEPKRYQIVDELKQQVTFLTGNVQQLSIALAKAEAPQQFDLILFRNVLIYFDHDTVAQVADALHQHLTDQGVMILGPSDPIHEFTPPLGLKQQGDKLYLVKQALETKTQQQAPTAPAVTDQFTTCKPKAVVERKVKEPERHFAELEPLVDQLLHSGYAQEAQEEAEKYVAQHPLDANGRRLLGLLYLQFGQRDQAKRQLKKALYLQQGDPFILLTLGQIANAERNDQVALAYLRRALQQLQRLEDQGQTEASHDQLVRTVTRTLRIIEARGERK